MPSPLDWPLEAAPSAEAEYDGYAEAYDLGIGARSVDLDFYVDEARQVAGEGGELIELGTGTGRVAERLVQAGFGVIGVDFSARMLARAAERVGRLAGRYRTVRADVRQLDLGAPVRLVIAPFGMVAHLLTEADRQATFRAVFAHLEPGGSFVLDDMPSWLHPADGAVLDLVREEHDPATGLTVRLLTNSIDVAGQPLTLSYHFIDWLDGARLVKRSVARLLFHNAPLADDLASLAAAGFGPIEVLGGFDGRPFVPGDPGANQRLILRCRKPG
jgi:SAM-dependent methyltransferase